MDSLDISRVDSQNENGLFYLLSQLGRKYENAPSLRESNGDLSLECMQFYLMNEERLEEFILSMKDLKEMNEDDFKTIMKGKFR